jgi:hypothetical protein
MSEPTRDANSVLFGGGGAPAHAWHSIGDVCEGEIVALDTTQQRDIRDKSKLVLWPDGTPKMVALVTLKTAQRNPEIEDDDGERTLWVSGKYLTAAVREAVKAGGARLLDIGGYLSVVYVGDGEAQVGFNAPRLFTATYRKPAPGAVAANAALGVQQPVQQPVQQQPPQAPAQNGQTIDLSTLTPEARAMVEQLQRQASGQ